MPPRLVHAPPKPPPATRRWAPPGWRTITLASVRADATAGAPPRSFEPSTLSVRHFINLKNGVEAIPTLRAVGIDDYAFVRIQSTLCEVGDMEKMLLELDANLLVSLALGYSCVVYDFGSRDKKRGVPRALWYGLEFTRFALNRYWFDGEDVPTRPCCGETRRWRFSTQALVAVQERQETHQVLPQVRAPGGASRIPRGSARGSVRGDDEGRRRGILRRDPPRLVRTRGAIAANATAVSAVTTTKAKGSPPRTEAEVAAALEGAGLSMFYGEHDEEWTNRWVHHREA